MKLLFENWRDYQSKLQSQDKLETIGDLRKVIKAARVKKAGGVVGKRAAKILIGMFPGGGSALELIDSAKDGVDLLRQIYSKKDSMKTNTGLDNFNVDDDVSEIVDDAVEVEFFKYLVNDRFKKLGDDTKLEDFDATKMLQDFLANKYDGTTVKK